jgi:FPC/CPF motif-containing protein YcgG
VAIIALAKYLDHGPEFAVRALFGCFGFLRFASADTPNQNTSDRLIDSSDLVRLGQTEQLVVAIQGEVYDLTSFRLQHPVGEEILNALNGTDATNAFFQVHNTLLLQRLAPYRIGRFTDPALFEASQLVTPHSHIPPKSDFSPSSSVRPFLATEVALAKQQFRDFVLSEPFSCVAGKTAFRRGLFRYDMFDASSDNELMRLHQSIRDFTHWQNEQWSRGQKFVSFVAQFPLAVRPKATESEFETFLFSVLRRLNLIDVSQGFTWDQDTSSDPTSSHFAFSLCGRAFFIVGGFPNSSRNTRQFPNHATLVFNSHAQFEALREAKMFTLFQTAIRGREITKTFNKNINPNLSESSEPGQFSGKAIDSSWTFPFEIKHVPSAM